MSKSVTRTWDPRRMFDMTPEERKAVEERVKIRNELKNEFMKKVSSPYRGSTGHLVSFWLKSLPIVCEYVYLPVFIYLWHSLLRFRISSRIRDINELFWFFVLEELF